MMQDATLACVVILITAHLFCLYDENTAVGNVPMCSMDEVGERLKPLRERLRAGKALFRGAPKVKTSYVKDIFRNESMGQIPSVSVDEMALARNLVLRHAPFVIRNVSTVKHLQRKWTQTYLNKELGSTRWAVDVYRNKQLRYVARHLWKKMKAQDPLGAQRLLKGTGFPKRIYRNTSWLFNHAAKQRPRGRGRLRNEFSMYAMKDYDGADEKPLRQAFDQFMSLVRELRPDENAEMRIGFNELHFSTHFDLYANFLAQVAGVKRIVLFNPLEEHKLHWERNSDHPHFRNSRVWPRLNLRQDSDYPDFMTAEALQVVLRPGDVLFIPPLWWHYIEAKLPVDTDNVGATSVPFWLNVNIWAHAQSSDGQHRFICPQTSA